MPVQDLRATDLDALYGRLLRSGGRGGRPLSLTSVHHVHAVMSKFLHDAERKGLVARNVAPLANAPSLTTARSEGPEMRVWNPDELSRFLEAIVGNRNEALFRVMAMTGVRRSEAIGLRAGRQRRAAIPAAFAEVANALGIDPRFVASETGAMDTAVLAKTASRQVLGVMNEFTFMAEHAFSTGHADPNDLVGLSCWLADTIVGPLTKGDGYTAFGRALPSRRKRDLGGMSRCSVFTFRPEFGSR